MQHCITVSARSQLQSTYHESFDSDHNLGAGLQIISLIEFCETLSEVLIWNDYFGTSECILRIIWFFDSDRDFGARIANHLIQIRTSEHRVWIIWFRSERQSTECESFDSDQNVRAQSVNHLIQIRTSEHRVWIIWFRSELRSTECESSDLVQNLIARIANRLILIGTSERGTWIIWFSLELQIANHFI